MIGRVARNGNEKAILYVDVTTRAMKQAIDETDRRRQLQIAFNEDNGISPVSSVRKLAGEETSTEEPAVHTEAFCENLSDLCDQITDKGSSEEHTTELHSLLRSTYD